MPNPRSTAQIAGHPIHPMVIPFPIACFVLALVSDLAFWKTSNDFWATASLWLLGIGLIMAAVAAVMGLIDVSADQQIRNLSDAWLHAGGNVVAVVIELYNWYSRYEHGNTAILPTGKWSIVIASVSSISLTESRACVRQPQVASGERIAVMRGGSRRKGTPPALRERAHHGNRLKKSQMISAPSMS